MSVFERSLASQEANSVASRDCRYRTVAVTHESIPSDVGFFLGMCHGSSVGFLGAYTCAAICLKFSHSPQRMK